MIKNIIFDIGNVILRWDPSTVLARLFPERDVTLLTQALFKSTLWYDLNLGKITQEEAIRIYHQKLNIDIKKLNILMHELKESLLPIDYSIDLLMHLYRSQYALYALTDNVREIIAYLKTKYSFWDKFNGIVVSADVGYLKPAPDIYQHLINTYNINPDESIFIDDHLPNVDGARSVGMYGIQFINANQVWMN